MSSRLAAALVLFLVACRAPEAAPRTSAAAPARDLAPSAARVTTRGDIATTNLDAQIVGLERAAAAPDHDLGHTLGLLARVGARGKYLGRIADLERADALAEQAVRSAPHDRDALLARAGTRAALHRFDDALADLAAAAAAGVDAQKIARQRASIWLALGRVDEALPVLEQAARDTPSVDSLGTIAAVYGQLGRLDEAHARFAEALAGYHDISPFPVAWLEFEEGQMWEREGRVAQARALYASAHARLPAYAHAAAHLASLVAREGERAQAIALLTPLLESSDDPEIPGLLAPLLRDAGRADEAAAMLARARRGYEDLSARHLEAFADHAARFWMSAGADAGKAHALAQANLKLRQSEPAYLLAIEAALAAGDERDACSTADAARTRSHVGKPLLAVAWRAYTACGRKADATAVDALLATR